jgi:hypothetical protein
LRCAGRVERLLRHLLRLLGILIGCGEQCPVLVAQALAGLKREHGRKDDQNAFQELHFVLLEVSVGLLPSCGAASIAKKAAGDELSLA